MSTATAASASASAPVGLGIAPPLLPAFLITGFFLAIAVTVLTWRHFRWQAQDEARRRRALARQSALTDKRVPKLWEVWVEDGNEKPVQCNEWNTVMPLSATTFATNTEEPPPSPRPRKLSEREQTAANSVQVACVITMPQKSHHRPRCSSDTMTNGNEYAIGVAVCETRSQELPPMGGGEKRQVKQSVELPACLV